MNHFPLVSIPTKLHLKKTTNVEDFSLKAAMSKAGPLLA
jgi:hypothetical protein